MHKVEVAVHRTAKLCMFLVNYLIIISTNLVYT